MLKKKWCVKVRITNDSGDITNDFFVGDFWFKRSAENYRIDMQMTWRLMDGIWHRDNFEYYVIEREF